MPAPRRRRSENEILDLDYLANNSSLDGMLSHLKPELRTAFVDSPPAATEAPMGQSPMGQQPMGQEPVGPATDDWLDHESQSVNISGAGQRRLRRCSSVRDGHTNGEQVAYVALWSHAWRFGQREEDGSCLIELGIAAACQLLSTDHKHARKLLNSLEAKLAIAVVRPPNCRLNTPTLYRVFSEAQVAERREAAGLVWVVRNRSTRFVPLEEVAGLSTATHGAIAHG